MWNLNRCLVSDMWTQNVCLVCLHMYTCQTLTTFGSVFVKFRTCRITLLIRALTDGVKTWLVLWKHHRTMPPLLKIVNKSNILILVWLFLTNRKWIWSFGYFRATSRKFTTRIEASDWLNSGNGDVIIIPTRLSHHKPQNTLWIVFRRVK